MTADFSSRTTFPANPPLGASTNEPSDAAQANLLVGERRNAHRYDIHEPVNEELVARLIVHLDRKQQPEFAELQIIDELAGQERTARREAEKLIRRTYRFGQPMELYVWSGTEKGLIAIASSGGPAAAEPAVLVTDHRPSTPVVQPYAPAGGNYAGSQAAATSARDDFSLLSVMAVVGALFLLVALVIWGGSMLLRGWNDAPEQAAMAPALDEGAAAAALAAAPPAMGSSTLPDKALSPQTNGLPPSRNADRSLGVGSTARIRAQLKAFVRSEPSAELGETLAFVQDGEEMTLLGGPYYSQGDTDTIVWWYVQTAAGGQGWVPANTSQLTLLESVE